MTTTAADTQRVNDLLWTVVTRDKGGRFYRPVAGAFASTWPQARAQAMALTTSVDLDRVQVWYVPAQGWQGIPEDQDNVLEPGERAGQDRRFPIRWDAGPKHTLTLQGVQEALAAIGDEPTEYWQEMADQLQTLIAHLTPAAEEAAVTPTPTPLIEVLADTDLPATECADCGTDLLPGELDGRCGPCADAKLADDVRATAAQRLADYQADLAAVRELFWAAGEDGGYDALRAAEEASNDLSDHLEKLAESLAAVLSVR